MRPSGDRGRILYLSHNGLTEPLGRRQVLPYVVGLASRNFELTVVSFEKAETAVPEAVARVTRHRDSSSRSLEAIALSQSAPSRRHGWSTSFRVSPFASG